MGLIMTTQLPSKERLEEIEACSWMDDLGLSMAELAAMARALLAACEQEPEAYMHIERKDAHLPEHLSAEAIKSGRYYPLYARPAPSIPAAEHQRVIEMLLSVCGAAFELADDSCEQEVEGETCTVVPSDAFQKLSDALDEIENTLPAEDADRPDVCLVWAAMPRAALKQLLHTAPSIPAVPDMKSFEQVAEEVADNVGAYSIRDCIIASVWWNKCRAAMLQADHRETIRSQHAEWSQVTFGNVGPVGPLKHLSKEALEAAAEPDDLSEWADMQFLLWDAQRRAGITDEQINQAMIEKLAVNKAREWPEPKDGEPRLHIKSAPKGV